MHNIDLTYEKNLLELLDYNIVGPDNSNRFQIYDKDKLVGYIQYKKIQNKNIKKGNPAIYGLVTNIDSKDIIFNNIRKIYDNGFNIYSNSDMNTYTFDIKRDKDIDHVYLTIGEVLYIDIFSKQYGLVKLSINYDGLLLFFNSKTEKLNIKEVINFKQDKNGLSHYSYTISYCDKDLKITGDRGVTTREISGYSALPNKLKIFEKTYVNDRLRSKKENDVEGTAIEMATKHQMGIDSFNHFRYLLNKILPFKYDIIDEVVTDEMIDEYNLKLFIPKEENKTLIKENNNEKR